MAIFTDQLRTVFPRGNYGFAGAIRNGTFKYRQGTLGIYNRLSVPSEFYDCATAMRFTVRALRNNGAEADACLLTIPTLGGIDGRTVTQHLVTLVKDKDSHPDLIIGITPFDELLGIYPYAEGIPKSPAVKLLKNCGQDDQNDEILNHSINPAGLLFRIRSQVLPGMDIIPLSACQHRGLFGIANMGLFFLERAGMFLFNYSADFYGRGNSQDYPLTMPAQRNLMIEMTPEKLSLLRQAIVSENLDFRGFYLWLQANEHRFTAFVDKVVCPSMSPFLKRAINRMLAVNWPTVAVFFNKLPPAVMNQE